MSKEEDFREAVGSVMDLYKIDGECSPELAAAFGTLRQLINEEFLHKNKFISSQLIYDILYPRIQALIAEAYKKGYVDCGINKLIEEGSKR